VGSNSFDLESFKWYADGRVERRATGTRGWKRLEYAFGRDYNRERDRRIGRHVKE